MSYASDSSSQIGNLIALAIGLQNAPEGFLVALFLINQQIGRLKAFLIATLTGAVEIVTSLLGFSLTSLFRELVPYGLAFAAGRCCLSFTKSSFPKAMAMEMNGHRRMRLLSAFCL
ncbi:Zinc transporter ZupT [Geobacillus sp. BCO2]|nr:Zinc transporter ZupT [Geobacillus sp. BCO2]